MSKVLITGANGFIGSHLVEKYLSEGHDVYGLVRTTSDLSLIEGMNLSLRYGDITDYNSLQESLREIDILIHNAGLASDWGSLELFREVNLEGTINAAKAAAENGVKRIVHMSTTAIHGFNHHHDHPASEEDPKNPIFNYGMSKLEAEKWLFDFEKETDIEVTVIRPGNVFGPRDHTFIEKYMDAMLCGKIAYINKGQSLTCPTFVGNLVQGVYLASFHPKASGEAFIITDGLSISWKQFTEAIADTMQIPGPRLSFPLGLGLSMATIAEGLYSLFNADNPPLLTRYRLYNAGTNYHFSILKAREILGYKPAVNLEQAIEQTTVWFREGK